MHRLEVQARMLRILPPQTVGFTCLLPDRHRQQAIGIEEVVSEIGVHNST